VFSLLAFRFAAKCQLIKKNNLVYYRLLCQA